MGFICVFRLLFFSLTRSLCTSIVHISHYVNTVKMYLAKERGREGAREREKSGHSHCVPQNCVHMQQIFAYDRTYKSFLSVGTVRASGGEHALKEIFSSTCLIILLLLLAARSHSLSRPIPLIFKLFSDKNCSFLEQRI
jgi:hypothetical protein